MTKIGTEGLALFRQAIPPPYAPESETSRQAAVVQGRGKAADDRARIFAYLVGCPKGATAGEIELALNLSGSTVRPRLLELGPGIGGRPGLNLIHKTKERRVIPGHLAATVWCAR